MLLFVGVSPSVALPTFSLSSGIGSTPIARATAWPDGNSILHPRRRLRSASDDGLTATLAGSEPSGFTREVSGLYAGWRRSLPLVGAFGSKRKKSDQSMA